MWAMSGGKPDLRVWKVQEQEVSVQLRVFHSPEHRPFYWRGQENAALLVHGFPGTPAEMRRAGALLHRQGWTAHGLLLPGFGNTIGDLPQRRHADWVAAIEQGLYKKNATYRVFNLGVNFDTPLQRSIELRDIIDSKPALVIYGDSYCSFSSRYRYVPDDNIALVSGRVRIDDFTRSLFDPEQVALMEQNQFDQLLFKRKFIVPAIKNRLGITLGGRDVVVNDSLTLEEKMIIVKNPYDEFLAPVDSETNVQKKAFIHMGDEFRKAGIPFVYIHMPMETLRVETIMNETKANYFDFLNSSGVRYYNFENTYPDSDFFDLVHLNKYGKSRFSSDMPAFILQELN